ncbi:MAG: primase-helicase family protein [Reyranella sp.]
MRADYEDYDIDELCSEAGCDSEPAPEANSDPDKEWMEHPVEVSTLPATTAPGTCLEGLSTTWAELIELYRDNAGLNEEPSVHSLFRFEGGRSREHAREAYGVIVEVDGARKSWTLDTIEAELRKNGLCGVLYTTRSHSDQSPHFRVVLPLVMPVMADKYERIVRHVDGVIFGGQCDPSGRKPTQFQRLPGYGSEVRVIDGKPLDPSTVPGGSEGGAPLIPAGMMLFPAPSGVQQLGHVKTCSPPECVAALLDPARVNSLDEVERVAGLLGQVCVMQGDAFRVRVPNGTWIDATQRTAISLLKENWSRINYVKIEGRLIEEVFRRSLLPVVSGELVSPVGSPWVEYHDRRYLNRGIAPRLPPSEIGADGRLLIDFINLNICADERDREEIEREVLNGGTSATRWVWHWLAHQYQKPGIPLSTALWIISIEQGIGKTLFADLIRELFGLPNTTVVNAAELKGDWNDWMVGKTLIVADEINVIEKKSFYSTIKRWVGNPSLAIRKRNIGHWEVPSTANWLFLTNDPSPIAIDAADRRHMFLEAQGDLKKAQAMIEGMMPILNDPDRRRSALAELGAWLDQVHIDARLISRALPSALKSDIIETTSSPVERWLKHEVEVGRFTVGQQRSTKFLWATYKAWADDHGVFKGLIAEHIFTSQLGVVAKRGLIARYRSKIERGWKLIKLPPGVVPFEDMGLIKSPGVSKIKELIAKGK